MIRGLRYHERVQEEVREILRFYSVISDQLAEDFWNELPKPPTMLANIQKDTTLT